MPDRIEHFERIDGPGRPGSPGKPGGSSDTDNLPATRPDMKKAPVGALLCFGPLIPHHTGVAAVARSPARGLDSAYNNTMVTA
jgi:hypothetical protein